MTQRHPPFFWLLLGAIALYFLAPPVLNALPDLLGYELTKPTPTPSPYYGWPQYSQPAGECDHYTNNYGQEQVVCFSTPNAIDPTPYPAGGQ